MDSPLMETLDLSFLPRIAAGVQIVAWDGFSYVAADGRTFWSGAAPSAADLDSALMDPRPPAPPPAPVPESVGPAQLRIAMRHLHGISAGQVYAVISALPEAQQDDARDLWDYATAIKRDHPLVAAFAAAFGIAPADIDDVFRHAATI